MHSFAKIVAKLLANRLAPKLDELVSQSQSAFIRKRAIHDNVLFVQNMIKSFHRKKKPTLFLKVDISKAFDTVNWAYLLEVLQIFGFGHKWCNWISNLLGTSSSAVLLNGIPGQEIDHARGLRQGDPLSPMLFILAMEPLHKLFKKAKDLGLLSSLQRQRRFRCSLYADDVGLFIKPIREEMLVLRGILSVFVDASGLHTNMEKTEIFPISCNGVNLDDCLSIFPGRISNFPCKYLGLPLHTRKLGKLELQPLVDKVGSRIPGWKGRFFTSAGREVLVKNTLSSTPIYHLTILQQNKWLYKRIDRLRRAFLWKGDDPENISGGSCLLNWTAICKPKPLGGLGILNLEKFARALRLRWLWYEWKEENKPWINMEIPCDEMDRNLFRASTQISLGNGKKCKFWSDNWLQGYAPKDIAPTLFRLAKRKTNCVAFELHNNHWITSLRTITSINEINELVHLGSKLHEIRLHPNSLDSITWKWTNHGEYSAKSAYEMQFVGSVANTNFMPLWRAEAEPKHRFFGWLILHQRTLTAENLLLRHWPCDWICSLCTDAFEDANHLAKECSFTNTVWSQVCSWLDIMQTPNQLQDANILEWWTSIIHSTYGRRRRKLIGALLITWWQVWLERNRRIFHQKQLSATQVAFLVKENIDAIQILRHT